MKSKSFLWPLMILLVEFLWLLWCSEIPTGSFSRFQRVLLSHVEAILVHAAPLLVLAFGMTLVLMTAGIDLSVGSTTALIACVMARFAGGDSFWVWAVPTGLLIAITLGTFNAVMIVVMDIPPIIATLGTLFFYRGLCFVVLSEGRSSSVFNEVPGFAELGEFPWAVVIAGVAFFGIATWFRHSRWRREILMLGGNRVAARYAGILVDRRLFQVYLIVGLCGFLAALLGTAREGAVSASWQLGLELQIIVAVVLGGTRVDGGFGSVWGTVFGVFLVVMLDEGLRMLGRSELQPVLLGLLLITGVKLNQTWTENRLAANPQSVTD